MERICNSCGQKNTEDALFCEKCGKELQSTNLSKQKNETPLANNKKQTTAMESYHFLTWSYYLILFLFLLTNTISIVINGKYSAILLTILVLRIVLFAVALVFMIKERGQNVLGLSFPPLMVITSDIYSLLTQGFSTVTISVLLFFSLGVVSIIIAETVKEKMWAIIEIVYIGLLICFLFIYSSLWNFQDYAFEDNLAEVLSFIAYILVLVQVLLRNKKLLFNKKPVQPNPNGYSPYYTFNKKPEPNPNFWEEPASLNETWKAVDGVNREFALSGATLDIPSNMDRHNSYRLMFKHFAEDCSACARTEYNKKVFSLDTYLKHITKIYEHYMEEACNKAIQILVSDGIFHISQAELMNRHAEKYHLVIDDIAVTLKSIELTLRNNQQAAAGYMSLVPNLIGGGFGIKGAAKGIATATVFNTIRDSVEVGLVNGANKLKPAQKKELFRRINPNILFDHFFKDYWWVFLTLVEILNENGKDIWTQNADSFKYADATFSNFENPNFPKEQLTEILIKTILMKPYDKRFYEFLLKNYGKTDETSDIIKYFDFTELLVINHI